MRRAPCAADWVGVEVNSRGHIAYPRWCGGSSGISHQIDTAAIIYYTKNMAGWDAIDDYRDPDLNPDDCPAEYDDPGEWRYDEAVRRYAEDLVYGIDGDPLMQIHWENIEETLAEIGIVLDPATAQTQAQGS